MPRDEDVDIPSLTLDHDEVSDRHAIHAAKRRLNPPPARPLSSSANSVAYKKPSLAGVYILLILILAAASGAGFWLWQQNMQLKNELSNAKGHIEDLDHQLLAADVSANKQGETVEQTLKNHDSEIRKLWGVSYDRNRKAISDNADALDELKKKLSIMHDDISTQSKRVASQGDAFNELEANYNKLIESVASLDKTVKPIIADWSNYQTKVKDQADMLSSLQKEVASLKGNDEAQGLGLDQATQDLSTLHKKVAALEAKPSGATSTDLAAIKQTLSKHQEAINSNDAFRKQMNAQMLRLSKQINQVMLQLQLNSGSN